MQWTDTAALAALLVVTGCSGEPCRQRAADAVPAAPTVSGASPTPTPSTPTSVSKKQAAKRYLAIVKPYNVALQLEGW